MLAKLARASRSFSSGMARVAVSAWTWLALLSIGGFALIIAAIHVLFGLGWALLASGVALLVMACFVIRGLSHG
jgi:hypothetical protein